MGIERIYLNAVVVIVLVLVHRSQCSAYLSDHVKISKCCPQGSVLNVLTNENGIKNDYQCTVTREDGENNQTLFGYNLDIFDESQIPECGDAKLFDLDVDGELISSDGCIDMYNGVLHGVTCSDKFLVQVHKLFKCCAEGRTICLLRCKGIYFISAERLQTHLIMKLFN